MTKAQCPMTRARARALVIDHWAFTSHWKLVIALRLKLFQIHPHRRTHRCRNGATLNVLALDGVWPGLNDRINDGTGIFFDLVQSERGFPDWHVNVAGFVDF